MSYVTRVPRSERKKWGLAGRGGTGDLAAGRTPATHIEWKHAREHIVSCRTCCPESSVRRGGGLHRRDEDITPRWPADRWRRTTRTAWHRCGAVSRSWTATAVRP